MNNLRRFAGNKATKVDHFLGGSKAIISELEPLTKRWVT